MSIKLGVVLPSREISLDRFAIRDFTQAAESLGYETLVVYDHPTGGLKPEGNRGNTFSTPYIEPLVVLGALAMVTKKINLTTGVLVLPQRQTVLVAKQAAAVDILSGGRLRLGVGVGLNPTDYLALDQNYHNRGRRIESQISLLRELWTKELVTFQTESGDLVLAGINTLPVQRPIPLWMGGWSDPVIERTLRLADGWLATGIGSDPYIQTQARKFNQAKRKAGKPNFGIVGGIGNSGGGPEYWRFEFRNWKNLEATEIVFGTVGAGYGSDVERHIKAIEQFKKIINEESF